ncbi:MAG: hypothetical protein HPY66_0917 [Firmicutes bacterium]|nr:hypothetical protein [Bacillota bacterium]MDI6705960.1 hypothetical protein [Bacillota bacterium]
MKGKNAAVYMLTLLLSVAILAGCGDSGIKKVKENADIVKEYNDAIGTYNKLALSFTSLARLVDDEIKKGAAFDKAFWDKFTEEEKKVLTRKNAMESYTFNYREIEAVMDEIRPFIANVERYLKAASEYREGGGDADREKFAASHRQLYNDMMEQSSRIVNKFDGIYNSFVVGND